MQIKEIARYFLGIYDDGVLRGENWQSLAIFGYLNSKKIQGKNPKKPKRMETSQADIHRGQKFAFCIRSRWKSAIETEGKRPTSWKGIVEYPIS